MPGVRTLLVQALALGILITGAAAFTSMQRTVTLVVDGEATELRTYARSVGETLDRAGVTVGERDVLIPERGQPLANGDEVIVRTARPLVLDLDDRGPQVIWTTAANVDEALASVGVRASASFVSVSRSSLIPRDGLAVQVRTPRPVTVLADGERQDLTTTASTFREVLAQSKVAVGKRDLVSVRLDDRPQPGDVVTVTRVSGRTTIKSDPVPFSTQTRKDSSKFVGTRIVERAGRPGVVEKKYELRIINGKRSGVRLVEKRFKAKPITQIVVIGTKPIPRAPRAVANLNWPGLAACESGGRPTAVSSTGKYHGLYQFSIPTWRAVGGSGLPSKASPSEQLARAQKLFQIANWRTQWPVCGVRLFS
jgi:uncharacterized protein YabE (DUF348 family)